jgi:hypothetical protein
MISVEKSRMEKYVEVYTTPMPSSAPTTSGSPAKKSTELRAKKGIEVRKTKYGHLAHRPEEIDKKKVTAK